MMSRVCEVNIASRWPMSLACVVGLRGQPLDGATAQLDLLFMPDAAAPRHDRRSSAGS